jgi:predicted dehydrogenase
MGANHVRVVTRHQETELVAVVDPDESRARHLAESNGSTWLPTVDQLGGVDGVIVAVPTEYHMGLALPLVEGGTPVLLEKPLAPGLDEVRALVGAARASGSALMCGFVERFNPAVATAMDLLDDPVVHVLSVRHSPTTPRIRTSVVHDLLIHDIDLALRLASAPVSSTASNSWTAPTGVVELADCTIQFEGGAVATLSASRASQRKVRTVAICTEDVLVEVDLLRHDVTMYRHRFHEQLDQGGPTYRAETLVDIPFVRHEGEPLALQLGRFVELIRGEADAGAELDTLLQPHEVAAAVAAGSGAAA